MEPEWTKVSSKPITNAAAATFLRDFLAAPTGAAAASSGPKKSAVANGAAKPGATGRELRKYSKADTAALLRGLEKEVQREREE